jgi:sarcosine oxidase subunit beta
MTSVVVIGSGVIGAAIGYHLAMKGARVTLIDRSAPASAPSASWASAGGLRAQGRHAAQHAITAAAARRWPSLAAELDADLGASFGGHLHVAETAAEAESLRDRFVVDRAGGIDVEWLEAAAVRRLVPALSDAIIAGAYTPGDGQANPGLAARAFAAAAKRAGATCIVGQRAAPMLRDGRCVGVAWEGAGQTLADIIVLAAGAWSGAMLADLGLRLDLSWRGLQMVLSSRTAPILRPTVTAVGRNLSLKQTMTGEMMIGGRWFARPSGEAPWVEPIDAQVQRQWDAARAILPCLSDLTIGRSWAGAEAQSPDGLPFIGAFGPPGLYLATGFSNHGFQIAPVIGDLVAQDILESSQSLLFPFSPNRDIKS